MQLPIYFDNCSTTPVDPSVIEAMLPYFHEKFGNASSHAHTFGSDAEEAVDDAREAVAGLINALPGEIIFTSGATESLNLALTGVYEASGNKNDHIITIATEHNAVLDTCRFLEKKGASVTYLPVNKEGNINPAELENAISDHTILIAVMYANNETGLIHPVPELSAIAHKHNILFLTDATQAVGKISVDVDKDGIDMMAFSAHKIYGSKGIGALYVKKKKPAIQLSPIIHGGGHEKGLRSGTLNVPAIVGFGKACELAAQRAETDAENIAILRDKLEKGLLKIDNTVVNGGIADRLPGISNISFGNTDIIVEAISNEIAVATGSACSSANPEPSHVLKAMGLSPEQVHSSIRFSLGRFNTEEEVDYVIEKIREIIEI